MAQVVVVQVNQESEWTVVFHVKAVQDQILQVNGWLSVLTGTFHSSLVYQMYSMR